MTQQLKFSSVIYCIYYDAFCISHCDAFCINWIKK